MIAPTSRTMPRGVLALCLACVLVAFAAGIGGCAAWPHMVDSEQLREQLPVDARARAAAVAELARAAHTATRSETATSVQVLSTPVGDYPCGDAAECAVIQALFAARKQVVRHVTVNADGYTATTTSANATIARLLHTHIGMMQARLDTDRPINARDPLFKALFANHKSIDVVFANISDGVTASERGANRCGVDITHEHAKIVSGFVDIGMKEMMETHPVPASCPHAH